jgi:uncharacterized protein (TIGR03435 family)
MKWVCVLGNSDASQKRIIRMILVRRTVCEPTYRGKVLLNLACFTIGMILVFTARTNEAQAPTGNPSGGTSSVQKIDDTWQGTLHVPKTDQHPQIDLRIVVKVSKAETGALKVLNYSIDQGGGAMTASTASFQDGVLKFSIQSIDGNYEGKMSGDGKSIAGNWTQGGSPLPLLLERVTPETEWTIPPPPVKLPPMAADADPSFEVATIKPSKPDQPGKLFGVRGIHFRTINTTLTDLITFAYGVQQKQVVNPPSWMDSEKWDIDAQPDVPGAPNKQQVAIMVQKLLADRFQLTFHKDTKELSAYVLTVSKSGNKMTAGSTDPNQLPGLFFQRVGAPTILGVQNATMVDFAGLMQSAVLDRPVVDQTALAGKWNFLLKWTADESQFGGMGIKIPAPTDAADAPPPLFTAIQEQLGLKLDAGKAQVPVLVIDKAEKPSDN